MGLCLLQGEEGWNGVTVCATLCHKRTSKSLTVLNRDSKDARPPHPAQRLGVGEGSRIFLGDHLCQVSSGCRLSVLCYPRSGLPNLCAGAETLRVAAATEGHRARVQRVNRSCVQGSHPNQGKDLDAEESLGRSRAVNIWRRRWLVPLDQTSDPLILQKCALGCGYHPNGESPIAAGGNPGT